MEPLAINALADALEKHLGRQVLPSASENQINCTEALLWHWIERVQDERDGRRMGVISRNGNDGLHYEVTE